MSVSLEKSKLLNQKAHQHDEQENLVHEHLEEGSPRLCQGLPVNLPDKSEIEYSSIERTAEEIVHSSKYTDTKFTNNALIASVCDTHKACNSEEPDTSSPLTKKLKRSSNPTSLHRSSSRDRFQASPLGFVIRSKPKKIEFRDMAAETSILGENCSDDINLTPSSDLLVEDASNQSIAELTDSVVQVDSDGIHQRMSTECDHSYSKCTSPDFRNEVKSVFEGIFNNIECFSASPSVDIQTIRQYLSRKRQFVAFQNSQLDRAKLETIQSLVSCLGSRIIPEMNALKHCDTDSTNAGSPQDFAQGSKEIAATSVAESSLGRQLMSGQNLKKNLFYLHRDLVDSLKMLMLFANLILREYKKESVIDFEKIFDYILCFEIMKEDFSKTIKHFETIEKDAKSDKECCNYEIPLLHVQYLIKIIENYVAKVEYGVFIIKTHEKLHKEVQYTSANIRQMVQVIKINEFRTKRK